MENTDKLKNQVEELKRSLRSAIAAQRGLATLDVDPEETEVRKKIKKTNNK